MKTPKTGLLLTSSSHLAVRPNNPKLIRGLRQKIGRHQTTNPINLRIIEAIIVYFPKDRDELPGVEAQLCLQLEVTELGQGKRVLNCIPNLRVHVVPDTYFRVYIGAQLLRIVVVESHHSPDWRIYGVASMRKNAMVLNFVVAVVGVQLHYHVVRYETSTT